ncbi:MAG: hypothetical protein IKF11_06645 [Methanobrevibacter sp.]|nr:hypothetical protein [Methanobrevibacter sp.]
MTEKRFKMKKLEYESYFIDSQQEYVDEDEPKFKIDDERTMSDSQILDLLNENEQLKKDATTLIYANQDYRQQNLNLQKQLDYIQNSITNAIKHQKTELGQKALQEIIADYNE